MASGIVPDNCYLLLIRPSVPCIVARIECNCKILDHRNRHLCTYGQTHVPPIRIGDPWGNLQHIVDRIQLFIRKSVLYHSIHHISAREHGKIRNRDKINERCRTEVLAEQILRFIIRTRSIHHVRLNTIHASEEHSITSHPFAPVRTANTTNTVNTTNTINRNHSTGTEPYGYQPRAFFLLRVC